MKFTIWIALLLFPIASQAQVSAGLKAGTTGIGVELTTSITSNINARVSGTNFSHKFDGIYKDNPDLEYTMDSKVTSVGFTGDYYPFENNFRVTAGLYYHNFVIEGEGDPSEDFVVNGKNLTTMLLELYWEK